MAKAEPIADLEEETVSLALPAVDVTGLVGITITKFGAGLVSTGQHVAGEGDIFAARGEKMMVSRKVAESLEARGLAEMD